MRMRKSALLLILFTACGIDRTMNTVTSEETELLQGFHELPVASRVKIAADEEPGERLILCLTIKRKEDKLAAQNQEVLLYHTSESGEYQPSDTSDESTARLNGTATTDELGRILVETILPGDYGSSSDNRHIHTSITSASPIGYDIHFKQYTGFMSNRFISGSDQHFLADLKKLPNGTLVAFLTIEAKRIQP